MKKRNKILIFILVLALSLCLLPATALADPAGHDDAKTTDVPETPVPTQEVAETAAVEAVSPETEAVYNEDGQILYAAENSITYNNGGTVYNNGGTVYNNAGLVYNNGGLVYNNAGTVYANGGTVYNNAGKVFNNGASVYSNNGSVEDSAVHGYYKVSFAGDYSALAVIDGLEEEPASGLWLIAQDAVCTIKAKEGCTLIAAQASAGSLTEGPDGEYTLSNVDADVELTLQFKADTPVIGLESGTYNQTQSIELSAAGGAEIYYTTDGKDPDLESLLYEEPIQVEEGLEIRAVALIKGAEVSDVVSAAYAIPKLTAPKFETVEEGYPAIPAQSITVKNTGTVDASIKNVILSGDNANDFILSRTAGGRVSAGATDNSSWTIQPKQGLKAGSYHATATFTFDSGDQVEVRIIFKVTAPAGQN